MKNIVTANGLTFIKVGGRLVPDVKKNVCNQPTATTKRIIRELAEGKELSL